MSKLRNASFENKLEKCRQMVERLHTIPSFKPKEKGNTVPDFIDNIYKATQVHIDTQAIEEDCSDMVAKRKGLYTGQENSLLNRLTAINLYLDATPTIDDNVAERVLQITRRMRGAATPKKKNNEEDLTTQEMEDSTSALQKRTKHQTTYGSRYADLKHIITIVSKLGDNYAPLNPDITIASLNTLYKKIGLYNQKTEDLKTTKGRQQAKRRAAFKILVSQAKSIKKLVRSQFTYQSKEYKSLKIIRI